jgi:hypothetical protein
MPPMIFDQNVVLPFSLDLHQAHIPNFVSTVSVEYVQI